MERSATVLVTDLSGRGNKIFKSGDVVYERNFPAGNFDKLIAGRFLRENVVEAEKALAVEAEKEFELPPGEELEGFDGPHVGEETGEELDGSELNADGNEHETELEGKTKEGNKSRKKGGKK